MAKFAILFRFKGETVKGLIEHPSDRAAVVAKLCEGVGGRLDAYYLMFGEWDGLVIADVPDSRAGAAMSLAVSSSGAFAQLQTHELIESSEVAGVLATAATLTYTPPGG